MSGLLAGLSRGVGAGLKAYVDQRAREEDRALRERQLAIEQLKSGVILDESGSASWSPERQQELDLDRKMRQLGLTEKEAQIEKIRADTDRIRGARKSGGLIEQKTDDGPTGLLKNYKEDDARLPPEAKKTIETTGTKIAGKQAIRHAIAAALDQLKSKDLSDEDKVITGRELLKTLNSQEGADAIGAEEAKRLGGLLEFRILNLTEPGPMFGRDVPGFTRQVERNLERTDKTIEAMRGDIAKERERYGGGLLRGAPSREEKIKMLRERGL